MIVSKSACALLALGTTAFASLAEDNAPIAGALTESSDQVRIYNDHLTILASPYMEGRLPGTQGMERAKDYMEYWFRQSGLEPAFMTTETASDGTQILTPRNSFRQPFPLAGTAKLVDQSISVNGRELVGGTDFNVSGMGTAGSVTAPVVFVGYGIDSGPDGYSSFTSDSDRLDGKIALMLRFEPMDDAGNSRWADEGWSGNAGFANKFRAMRERGAAGVIVVNPPGSADSRSKTLPGLGSDNKLIGVPLAMMMPSGADAILAASGESRSLMDMRRMADEGATFVPLNCELTLNANIDTTPLMAENVGALLPGKGALADEIVVLGAHLDHLGTGLFGSRAPAEAGTLHPGADDNASGSAAVLMLADRLAKSYAEMPADANARTLVFMGFSAEESGLNGSRYYAENPIEPIGDHVMMMNFDMIGRITNDRLSVSGGSTAIGMADWAQPYFDASPLEIVTPENMSGASDHTPFYRKGVPVLFGIIADFHNDYHTPADVSWKINRVGAVQTIDLFEQLLYGAATKAERFVYNTPAPRNTASAAGTPARRGGGPEMNIKVRFGIMPGNYDEGESGVLVGGVSDDTSASEAGILAEDVLIKWNGETINDVGAWMGMLSKHDPGDKVQVTVLREQEEKVLWVTLKGRTQGGR